MVSRYFYLFDVAVINHKNKKVTKIEKIFYVLRLCDRVTYQISYFVKSIVVTFSESL